MIILSLLSIFFNFSSPAHTTDVTCNQLVEVISDRGTGTMTYCNRYKIPVVDGNGKMMFDIGLQRIGTKNRLSMLPAMNCRFVPGGNVTVVFADHTKFVIPSHSQADDSQIEIEIEDDLRSKMMTDNVLSIALEGKKYPYNVILKPNQGRLVQDVMNCLQN